MAEETKLLRPKKYFGLILNSLKLFGVAIEDLPDSYRSTLYNIYSVTFLVVCVYYYILAQAIDLIQHISDFDYVTFSMCYLVTQGTGIFKGTLLFIYRKSIQAFCEKLESGYFLPDVERGGAEEFTRVGRAVRFCNTQAIVFYAFVVLIVANRAVDAALNPATVVAVFDDATNTTAETVVRSLPYNIYLPFDTQRHYGVSFVYQVYSCTAIGLYIGACDALICGIMVHIKTQIVILKNSLDYLVHWAHHVHQQYNKDRKLIYNVKACSYGKAPPGLQAHLRIVTGKIIGHHQGIIELAEEAEDKFSLIFLFQFLTSLLLMCLQLYQLSIYDVNSPKFISMVIYLLLMLFQLLIYCWNGNEVTLESLKVAQKVFDSDWIVCDDGIQKALMQMMQRAQKPIRFSAGKFVYLSLETYTTILRGSASYFLALRRMNEDI